MSDFSKERTGTGTKEWSDESANAYVGCPHNCLYCYARELAMKYKRINSRDDWTVETLNPKALTRKWFRSNKVVMFPTAHDITPTNIDNCITFLKHILTPGNKALMVSKPHLSCVQKLCAELQPWKEQILFRFTIGSIDEELCKFWEPGAPTPDERLSALAFAHVSGYQTSVSMEPMLSSVDDAIRTFAEVESFVTETIWIGKMNDIDKRVHIDSPQVAEAVARIKELQGDAEILRLVECLGGNPKVRWKDSVKRIIRVNRYEKEEGK